MRYPLLRFFAIIITLLISDLILINKAQAQFTINENFHGNVVGNNIVLGGAPTAFLTSGSSDPANEGWLRLTNSAGFQKGYAYISTSFPSTLGILIDFEYKTWRDIIGEGGGDGFSVFLFNSTATFSLGGYGGSLGYAPDGNVLGLAGGYLGIGFDEYGNFSNPTQGRVLGPGLSPNSIVLRGPTTASATTTNKYLKGATLNISTSPIGYGSPAYIRPADSEFYRRVKISIVPIGTPTNPKYTVTVMWRTTPTGKDVTLLTYDTVDPIPANLKLGFAASTGGSTNYHEIRNLVITTPGGVRIDKSVDKLNAKVGDQLTYKIDVYNSTTSAITDLLLSDTLKAYDGSILKVYDGSSLKPGIVEINSITFNNNNNIGNTVTGFTTGVPVTTGFTNPFKINSLSMDANTVSTFTVIGTIKAMPIGGIIKNTATIDVSQTGIVDLDSTNNTSTASTIIPNIDFIIKTNFDKNCADPANGNALTLLVTNIGSTSSLANNLVTVKDTVPTGFTVVNTTNTGWGASHVGNIYTFTRNDALASTSSYPPITINVKPPSNGISWGNSATVTYAGIEANTFNNNSSDTLFTQAATPTVVSPIAYCKGETAAALTATGTNLKWYTTQTGTGSETAPVPDTTTPGNTTYYVSGSNGFCESPLVPVVVNVSKPSTATISGSTSVCKDSVAIVTFIGKDGTAPYTFTYNINGGTNQTIVSNKGDTATVVASTKTSGVFTYNLVSVMDSKSCSAVQTGSAVITIYQPLTATIDGITSICKDSIYSIHFTGKGGVSPYTFTYNINGGSNQTITTTKDDTISVVVPTNTAGAFTFNLVGVLDTRSCLNPQKNAVTFNVIECFVSIIIPNAFTPNADGYNDTFGPIVEGIETLDMSINDRNGRLVHLIDKRDGKWDGLMPSGEQASTGVYFYKLNAIGVNKNAYTRQGSISLYRNLVDPTPIQVIPNPVKQNALVDLSNVMTGSKIISICNASGRLIRTWNTSDAILRLDLSNYDQGLYILKISGNQQVQFIKFIKE